MKKYDNLLPRFLKYVKTNTRSDENSTSLPSTDRQITFLNTLKTELEEIGLSEVKLNTKNYYLTAKIPGNTKKDVPTIGFISHIDTADFESEHVNPQIVENYDGKSVIKLDEKGEYVLDPKEFSSLTKYASQTLITTDGSTLLGADDKSGVAELVTFAENMQNSETEHGDIKIAFGPDEEIGTGANLFDVGDFGADFAYTVDGGPLGELEYETFNAASLKVDIKGKNVHPGSAKDIMVNSISLGIEFQNQLPPTEVPELTDGKDGFFHLLNFNGTVDESHLDYIIRDFTREGLNSRKQQAQDIADKINAKYDDNPVTVTMKDDYYNMYEVLKDNMKPVELARKAMVKFDIKPIEEPIRGGTDGSKISFMGLPTPNLFAGGENMHGRFEYVSLQTMEAAINVLKEIVHINVAE